MPYSQLYKRSLSLPRIDPTVDTNSEYYKRNVLPVDHGWAWVICFAGFLVYFVFGVSNQTLVVLFVEIVHFYDTTVTVGSLVFMFSIFAVGIMSIISTKFLAPRFGEKAVVATAGVVNMIGTLGMSFSPTIGSFIAFSVVKGMATGAVFVPSISLIRLYFHKRRSIAQIMANVGQSAAVIIAPSVVRVIRHNYGITGTLIILAGVDLHMTVAGLLLRPVSFYKFRPKACEMREKNSKGACDEMTENRACRKESKFNKFRRRFTITKRSSTKRSGDIGNAKKTASTVGTSAQITDKITNNVLEVNSATKYDDSELQEEGPDVERRRYWTLRLIVLATIPGAVNLYLRNYIPTIMEGQGVHLDKAALLLTIVGAVDLVSRLCTGLFTDLHILTSVNIVLIAQLCLATVCHCMSLFTIYEILIFYAILIGCFVGTRITMLPLMALEIVGLEKMPQALSILSTVGALSTAVMNPIFGYIATKNGNFVAVMHIIGGCLIVSSCIMMSVPFILALCEVHLLEDDEDNELPVYLNTKEVRKNKISAVTLSPTNPSTVQPCLPAVEKLEDIEDKKDIEDIEDIEDIDGNDDKPN